MMDRDLPLRDRPVKRLRDAGPIALSTPELLACLLQTPEALQHAQVLLSEYNGLRALSLASEDELETLHGIGPAAAARVRAAMELGRRIAMEEVEGDKVPIRAPANLAHLLLAELRDLEQEHFVVVLLDRRNRMFYRHTLYIGSLSQNHIRAAEVFKEAIRRCAAAVIIAHNHPSGDPTPSPEDVHVTTQLVAAGDLLDIELLDHIIVGADRWISLRERALGGFK